MADKGVHGFGSGGSKKGAAGQEAKFTVEKAPVKLH